MKTKLMSLPVAIAVAVCAQGAAFAQATDTARTAQPAQTRGEAAIHMDRIRLADVPAGHWATNASQVAVANNILSLKDGEFRGAEPVTTTELKQAMEAIATTGENIAGKGVNQQLRAAIGAIPDSDSTITRLQLAQGLSRLLDAASSQELVALGSPKTEASRLRDLGASVPPAVKSVVDKYKVMTGFPDGTFKPGNTVTRYELAAIALHVLDMMREAPIAQTPVTPSTTVVVVPPEQQPEEVAEVPAEPTSRLNFRENAPIVLSWQALNVNSLQASSAGAGAFSVIPVQGMFTGYQGPVMLQNVTNFRYSAFNNVLDTEFRLGFSDLKLGMLQLIPYVGANLGVGTSVPAANTQYDTYVGATYGGILSVMPMDNLEIWGQAGQSALLAGGRWNQNFQAVNYPQALGSAIANYGLGLDFYVSPNIALTVGFNGTQQPANLTTATNLADGGVINTYGGNVGLGFGF